MSPLHHHFELGGWSETKVVGVFWLVGLICGLLGLSVVLSSTVGGLR
jgi:phospho-N-acetylmuramoyl-pentapeptide-transferase